MATREQIYTTRILLNSEQAQQELSKLNKKVDELKRKREDAWKAGDTETWKKLGKEIEGVEKKAHRVEGKLKSIEHTLDNMSDAGPRQLKDTIKAINDLLNSGAVERGSEQWDSLTASLREAKAEMQKIKEMRQPEKEQDGLLSRGWSWLNRNWGAVTQIIDAYSGVRDVIKGSVEAFAEMDQEMENVRKYTGQTKEQVLQMNEAFKQMDTRTPREQLNQLAGSAGRLGITSQEAVLQFVDAADKINVALGDDLGRGAVDQIGKLAMAFGEDEKMGLRGAMLATGSAINELAQNSAAQAGYLVDFAARLSGVGIQAGLSQAQIMGLGAALDENMQKDEMAATALMKLITMMATDSTKFAAIAGKSVEEFSSLVKKDMNAALLQFFEAMNSKGGFTELAPMFEQLGLDGSRATGVLAVLAGKIDDVRRHQQLATEAYAQGTSVIEEFNIQNETYQAKLEKARKAFGDLRIELGQKLLPVAQYAISTTSLLVRSLSILTGFVTNNWKAIVTLTSGIIAYNVAVNMATIKTKANAAVQLLWNGVLKTYHTTATVAKAGTLALAVAYNTLTGNTRRAAEAQRLLNTVVKSNQYVAAAIAVATLVGALLNLFSRTNELTSAQKRLIGVNRQAQSEIAGEKAELEALVETAKNKALADEVRQEAVRKLQNLYPDYLSNLSLERINSEEATTAIDNLTNSLLAEAKARVLIRELQGAEEEKAGLADEYFSGWSGFWNYIKAGAQSAVNDVADKTERAFNFTEGLFRGSLSGWGEQTWIERNGYGTTTAQQVLNNFNTAMRDINQQIGAMNSSLRETVQIQAGIGANNPLNNEGSPTSETAGQTTSYDTHSYWISQLEERRKKLAELRKDATATADEIDKAYKAVQEAEGKVGLFTGVKENKKERKEEKDRQKEANDAAKAETQQMLAELTHRYAMGELTYREYIERQREVQLQGIEKRMLIYGTETLEYQKLNRQREEMLLNGDEKNSQLRLQDLQKNMMQQQWEIEKQAAREEITEREKQIRLAQMEEVYLADKAKIYREGSKERMDAEWELEQAEQRNKLARERYFQQQLQQVRERYLEMGNEKQLQIAIEGAERLYKEGLLKEEEYQRALLAIRAQYAGYTTNSEQDQKTGSDALKIAQANSKRTLDDEGKKAVNIPIAGDIMLYKATMEQLEQMYKDDEITHAQYLAAKQQATAQFCESLASKMQAAYNTINQVMTAASSYFSAQQEYEVAMVQKKYEKQIEAAGSNQARVKKMQEKQQKEEAAIKTKYARRAANIQMAQAMAQTAISAINAYSSAAAVPIVGYILAPIAAAAALAAGMLQIATIKKQQQAQEAGYYEGGFTGGRKYRREAGVVHEGEFVANHQAVNNPAVLPFLSYLDKAQRNNTVGSLTMQDVVRNFGGGSQATVFQPVVNVQTDNTALQKELSRMSETNDRLTWQLQQPIDARVVLTGENGLNEQQRRLQKMLRNK